MTAHLVPFPDRLSPRADPVVVDVEKQLREQLRISNEGSLERLGHMIAKTLASAPLKSSASGKKPRLVGSGS